MTDNRDLQADHLRTAFFGVVMANLLPGMEIARVEGDVFEIGFGDEILPFSPTSDRELRMNNDCLPALARTKLSNALRSALKGKS